MMSEMCSVLNMSSKSKEIGSEFWIESDQEKLLLKRNGVYVLSGRTAIDLIIQDIQHTQEIRMVYMPAWCCDSMLAPFLDRNIAVQFYDIQLKDSLSYAIDDSAVPDILYLTNYFGYENTLPLETVKRFKEKGSIILYDRTHSFLMEDSTYQIIADYSFASIRKWMGVIGGAVVTGLTQDYPLNECPYASVKRRAMQDKYLYLQGDRRINKQDYLNAFGDFGHCLAQDYRNYIMDDLSYSIYKEQDVAVMKAKRQKNAVFLHSNLHGLKLLGNLTEDAAPLFVPVFFESKDKRNAVRRGLIESQIYCPIHWPKPQLIPIEFNVNDIFDTELSLVCDQRYNLSDISRIVEVIQRYI